MASRCSLFWFLVLFCFSHRFVLFCFVLFCFVLFCFVLFCLFVCFVLFLHIKFVISGHQSAAYKPIQV